MAAVTSGTNQQLSILGDPGADSGGERKSKRAGKYGTKKGKERREEPPRDNVLPDQFQTVAVVLPSDWAEKHKSFLAPIRSQNDHDTFLCKTHLNCTLKLNHLQHGKPISSPLPLWD